MSDSFCRPYFNPRTRNQTYGGAARNGRLKTLGGVDELISQAVTRTLIAYIDQIPDQAKARRG